VKKSKKRRTFLNSRYHDFEQFIFYPFILIKISENCEFEFDFGFDDFGCSKVIESEAF
jgi:hypothetical protein